MTKFTPKPIERNVNISHTSSVREFFMLFLGLLGVLIVSYVLLGLTLNLLISQMPLKFENSISHFYNPDKWETAEIDDVNQKNVQKVLDGLVDHLPVKDKEYRVFIVQDEMVNAFALPGGNILIMDGLLKDIDTENELAMVLAHELGHYQNKDQLKGLSRGIVVVFLTSVIFGNNNNVTGFVSGALTSLEMKFSRVQEAQADQFGLMLLNKTYGHVGGATDFFLKLKEKEKLPKFLRYFSSHPIDEIRIKQIQHLIGTNSYPIKEKIPFSLEKKTVEESSG